jgi:hypothetical protein
LDAVEKMTRVLDRAEGELLGGRRLKCARRMRAFRFDAAMTREWLR